MNFRNKPDHLSLASLSSLILMFAGKAKDYLSEATERYSTLGRLLASPTNIRLGWKGLPGTKSLAFYKKLKITAVKFFIVLDPRH